MGEFGWAYIKGALTASGPTGSLQFRDDDDGGTNDGVLTGSARLTFNTASNSLLVTGSVIINGDLIVSGTSFSISSSNLVIHDPIIGLGFGTSSAMTGAAGDRGFIFGLPTDNNQALLWDQTSASFIVGKVGAPGPERGAYDIAEGNYSTLKVGNLRASGTTGQVFAYKILTSGDVNVSGNYSGSKGLFTNQLNVAGPFRVTGSFSGSKGIFNHQLDVAGNLGVSGTQAYKGVGTHEAHDIFNVGITLKNGNDSAGYINFYEKSEFGTNVCTFRGKSSMGNCTITLPGQTGIVVLEDNTVTLSNKTLASPTVTGQLSAADISGSKGIFNHQLNVAGPFRVTGSFSGSKGIFNHQLDVAGNLGVSGSTSIKGDFSGSKGIFNHQLNVADNLRVSGSFSGSKGIFNHQLDVAGNLGVSGSATVVGQLNVTGNAVVTGTLSGTTGILANDLFIAGKCVVSGNVGIGTSTPDYELDVAGDIGIGADSATPGQALIRHNGDTNTYIRFTSGGDVIDLLVGGVKPVAWAAAVTQINPQNADHNFRVDANADNALFVEGSSGKVGIGTGAPTQALTIVGALSASSDFITAKDAYVAGQLRLTGSLSASNRIFGYGLETSGQLGVTGSSVLKSTLSGTNAIFAQGVNVAGPLRVTGSFSGSSTGYLGALDVAGNLGVSGSTSIKGDFSGSKGIFNHQLNVAGPLSVTGTLSGTSDAIFARNVFIAGSALITGSAAITGNLFVSGNATFGDATGDSVTINAATVNIKNVATGSDPTSMQKTLMIDTAGKIVYGVGGSGGGGSTSPGGATTEVQFNDGGAFAGSSLMEFNKTTGQLSLTGTLSGSDAIFNSHVNIANQLRLTGSLSASNRIFGFGLETSGQLGVSGSSVLKSSLSGTSAIFANGVLVADQLRLTGSLSASNRVFGFGLETSGQLGVSGSTTLKSTVSGTNAIFANGVNIADQLRLTGSLSASNRIFGYGLETSGQLGVSGSSVFLGPVEINSTLSGTSALFANGVLMADQLRLTGSLSASNRIFGYGLETSGQLGVTGSSVLKSTLSGTNAVFANGVNVAGPLRVTGSFSGSSSGYLGTLDVAGNLNVTGTVSVAAKVARTGDTDTYIHFTDDDINFQAGGVNFLDLTEDTQNEITVNEGGVDIDFRVETADESHMIFIEGSTNRMSIGDNTGSPGATLEVKNHASAGAFDVPLVQLNSNDTDKTALDINASNIDAHVVDILANAITTANIINIKSDDSLVSGKAIAIDHNDAATTAVAPKGISYDFDKDGVVGEDVTSAYTGIEINMADAATNHGESTVVITGIDIDVDSASNQGVNTNLGIDIKCTDATSNYGIVIITDDDSSTSADIVMKSDGDPNDFAALAVGSNGALTITTADQAAAAADLVMNIDGDFVVNTTTAEKIELSTNTSTAPGGGFNITGAVTSYTAEVNGVIETTYLLDIVGLRSFASTNAAKRVIGEDGVAAAFFGRVDVAKNGIIYRAELGCIESPAGSATIIQDIDVVASTASRAQGDIYDSSGTNVALITAGGNWALGMFANSTFDPFGGAGMTSGLDDYYLYLVSGAAAGNDIDFNAGKFVLKLYGVKSF